MKKGFSKNNRQDIRLDDRRPARLRIGTDW